MGIRRCKLQKILYKEVKDKGISINFNKKVIHVHHLVGDSVSSMVRIQFRDGSHCTSPLVIAADGAKSVIRTQIMMKKNTDKSFKGTLKQGKLLRNIHAPLEEEDDDDDTNCETSHLTYTGTTCLYGVASIPDGMDGEPSCRLGNAIHQQRGICFPSSDTTKCHGCFYPVSSSELCFQFHIPTNIDGSRTAGDSHGTNVAGGGWGTVLTHVGQDYCKKLATEFEDDGWHAKYTEPLRTATQAIKMPFAVLNPPLSSFTLLGNSVVLVGDAAHPPVPYLGQGCQQGLEDVGTLALLLKHFCCDSSNQSLSTSDVPSPPPSPDSATMKRLSNIDTALRIYDKLRVPHTKHVLHELSQEMGELQLKRACGPSKHCQVKEEMIRRNVFFHETMNTIFPGATHDYKQAVVDILRTSPLTSVSGEQPDQNEDALQKQKWKRGMIDCQPKPPSVCRGYDSSDDDLDWSQAIYTCH